jgi:hypothetical protein
MSGHSDRSVRMKYSKWNGNTSFNVYTTDTYLSERNTPGLSLEISLAASRSRNFLLN